MLKESLFKFTIYNASPLEILTGWNYDLDTIITPIKVDILEQLLLQEKYNPDKTKFICEGFRGGFSIHYNGPVSREDFANNLKLHVGTKIDLWNKVMKEVQLKRFAGPFRHVPQRYKGGFVQSPLGW